MGVVGVLSIVFGSIAAEVLILTTIISYGANHFKTWGGNGDAEFGVVFMAVLWPLTVIPLIIWALTVTPKDYARFRPFLYPVFTIAFWQRVFARSQPPVAIDPGRNERLMEWASDSTRRDT